MTDASGLSMWTVYDHPPDFPQDFVAREWIVAPGGQLRVTDVVVVGPLETIRKSLGDLGLYCLPRAPSDDPVILETWL